jgi:hypothetical protein
VERGVAVLKGPRFLAFLVFVKKPSSNRLQVETIFLHVSKQNWYHEFLES